MRKRNVHRHTRRRDGDGGPRSETGDDLADQACVELVYKAKDTGDWKPVVDWLARNPHHAETFAVFFVADREVDHSFPIRPPTDHAGSSLDHFVMKELIGSGGMGDVYRAFDVTLKRDVAVKLIRTSGACSGKEADRFRFEAEMVASLHHENIVPVLFLG